MIIKYFKLKTGGTAEITKYSCYNFYIRYWNKNGIPIDSKKKRTTKKEITNKIKEFKEESEVCKWIITQGKC